MAVPFHTQMLPQVGHNALGAGQLIDQGASLVDNALRTGSMFSGEGWQVRCCCCLLSARAAAVI